MREEIQSKESIILENNEKIIKNPELSTPLKPLKSLQSESKLSEATLKNSSEVDLNHELDKEKSDNINKSSATITVLSVDSSNKINEINEKNSSSKNSITVEEDNGKIDNSLKASLSKKKHLQSSVADSKKKTKNDRNISALSEKMPASVQKSSKITKPIPPIHIPSKLKQKNSSSSNVTSTTTTTTSKVLKSPTATISTNKNLKSPTTHINENKTNSSNSLHMNSPHSSSSLSNISTSSQKKINANSPTLLDNHKKSQSKSSFTFGNGLFSANKSSSNQASKKIIKPDMRKNSSNLNESLNRSERNKQHSDYTFNRNNSQLKLKKNLYSQQKETPQINEKEIVLKSNEYRKALSKINSLEKTIKQLQTQHSETLSYLHAEIARLQNACSEKTLVEAFKGTGLLTSLSANNNNQNPQSLERVDSFTSSNDSLDQDTLIRALNNLPKGMNLLPKIPSIKKSTEENINISNEPKLSNDKNENSENKTVEEKNSNDNNMEEIKKLKDCNNNEIMDKMNSMKKKTSGNIRAHKYHSIDKHNSIKSPNVMINSSMNNPNISLSDSNLLSENKSQHKNMQSYVSLSDASTAVALSSGHSSSISSLIKSDLSLKDIKKEFNNGIKPNSKLNPSLNRQLPPPIPPLRGTNRSIESPRRLINLPKILQPIVKIKENKNTSVNLPSLIKNKSSKNSQRF